MYCVYIHKSPSNKYYVGVTRSLPEFRWGHNGYKYKNQKKFWNAICKYGWDKFEHTIVATELSKDEAYKLEKELIIKYDSLKNGYNSDAGGAGSENHVCSPETRQLLSKLKTGKPSPLAGKTREPRSKIYVYSTAGQLLYTFNGYNEASIELDLKKSTIINCANYLKLCDNKYIITNDSTNEYLDVIISRTLKKQKPKIFQFSLTGQLINTYNTLMQAQETTGIYFGTISKSCIGTALTASGFIFLRSADEIEARLALIEAHNKELEQTRYTFNYILELYKGAELIKQFEDYAAAAEFLETTNRNVSLLANGRLKNIKGYTIKKILREN